MVSVCSFLLWGHLRRPAALVGPVKTCFTHPSEAVYKRNSPIRSTTEMNDRVGSEPK
ncbi:MAG: hypothetical protein ACE5R6_16640 [Candidatus Heimdallarchaeota archaeon]